MLGINILRLQIEEEKDMRLFCNYLFVSELKHVVELTQMKYLLNICSLYMKMMYEVWCEYEYGES